MATANSYICVLWNTYYLYIDLISSLSADLIYIIPCGIIIIIFSFKAILLQV